MRLRLPAFSRTTWIVSGLIVLAGAGWLTQHLWLPTAAGLWNSTAGKPSTPAHADHADEESGTAAESIALSAQARRTIGLTTGKIVLGAYDRSITVPAIVTERPGRTDLIAAAPLSGFVVDVFAVPGQSVPAAAPLFVLRLTNEEVVQAQTDFLKSLEAIDVENREIRRLESIREGVIAEKVVLERKYELQKLQGLLKAQRQSLLLHGLSEEQVDTIAAKRQLLREFLITAPEPHDEQEADHLQRAHPGLASAAPAAAHASDGDAEPPESEVFVVRELPVRKGEIVASGQTLAVLSDLEHLFLEGRAFERDGPALHQAVENGWKVTAETQHRDVSPGSEITGLTLAYVANVVDPESRALKFYVLLPNEIVHRSTSSDGRIFPTWRFKPGQRMDVRIPVERFADRIVLPIDAVADEGLESYVFVENGRTFERRPVTVEFRDRQSAVIANDGSLFPGETVAMNDAHQLQLAIKNKAGGGVDPHAGHTH